MRRKRANSPREIVWFGSVQWETGPDSPVYVYAFGIDEEAVQQSLKHLQEAVVNKELEENRPYWLDWLGLSENTEEEDVREAILNSIRIREASSQRSDEMWIEGAHMPEVLEAIKSEPLVFDFITVSFEDLAPYCSVPEAFEEFVLDSFQLSAAEKVADASKERKMTRRRNPEPRRRALRRRAGSRDIREEVRERLERRAENDARRRERRDDSPRSRLAQLRQEQDRDVERRVRQAYLQGRRDQRAEASRHAAAPTTTPRRAPRRYVPAAQAETPKRFIHVKAGNSAGAVPGYYEYDEEATKQYQAQQRRIAASKRRPVRAPQR